MESELSSPTRTEAQRIGDHGERLVYGIVDSNSFWLARTQNHDFGIDLEAELASPLGSNQQLQGKLIKIQVKTKRTIKRYQRHIAISVDRALLSYANEFKLPVILAVVCLKTEEVWWVWVQEWVMLHEAQIARCPRRGSFTLHIPIEQKLTNGLDGPLPKIAAGDGPVSITLALRDILKASFGWENREIAESVVSLLNKVHGPSRVWMLQKVIDVLLGYGSEPPFWQTQQVLPVLLSLIDVAGDTFTKDQMLRLVARGASCSRTGIVAMGHFYDRWPEHARSLGLPCAFFETGSLQAAWYAAMRERFARKASAPFALWIARKHRAELQYENIRLPLDSDLRDYIFAKWPNRGDSVLIDCLIIDGSSSGQRKRRSKRKSEKSDSR